MSTPEKQNTRFETGIPDETSLSPQYSKEKVRAFVKGAEGQLLAFAHEERNAREKWSERIDKRTVGRIIDDARRIDKIGDRMLYIAKQLEGIPTKYDTLTPYSNVVRGASEEFIIDFTGLDCVTYVEAVLAMAHADSYDSFRKNLQNIRYARGEVSYGARNHYMTADWVPHNRGFVNDVTDALSDFRAQTVRKTLRLIDRDADGTKEAQPAEITFIPKGEISAIKGKIENGDIIIITSSRDDLDVRHTGLAEWHNGELYLRHAKQGKETQRDNTPLIPYLMGNRQFSGIQIIRPKKEKEESLVSAT